MEKLLLAEDVGKDWKLSRSGIYNLVASGLLPCVKFKTRGNRYTIRFRQEDLDSFIKGHLCDGRERSTT